MSRFGRRRIPGRTQLPERFQDIARMIQFIGRLLSDSRNDTKTTKCPGALLEDKEKSRMMQEINIKYEDNEGGDKGDAGR